MKRNSAPFSRIHHLLPLLCLTVLCTLLFIGCGAQEQESHTPSIGTLRLPIGAPENPVPSTDTTDIASTAAPPADLLTEAQTEPQIPPVLCFETVDDAYFDDALFIGDSCTDGLRMFNPPGEATIYAATSMTVYSVLDSRLKVGDCRGLRELLESRAFGKIYLMLGINEAGYGAESFLKQYQAVLEEIHAAQPDAILYIESILPVTSAFSAEQPTYAKENLSARNDALAAMADGETIFYLNIREVYSDGAGNLPASYSDDGVHLKPAYYEYWHTYLCEHAIVLP